VQKAAHIQWRLVLEVFGVKIPVWIIVNVY
jgi:hypothetical protein